MNTNQSNDTQYTAPSKVVKTVQDLIDFLTECVSRTPGLRDDEVHIELPKEKYYKVHKISLVDDNFILKTEPNESQPFWHEE